VFIDLPRRILGVILAALARLRSARHRAGGGALSAAPAGRCCPCDGKRWPEVQEAVVAFIVAANVAISAAAPRIRAAPSISGSAIAGYSG
jgi:hypothetical protein